MITLGKIYTDKITGFTGTAINYSEFLSKPASVGLAAKVTKDNKQLRNEYFTEARLGESLLGLDSPLAKHTVVFGKSYCDPITGFTGKAVGRTVHLNGCVHVHLQDVMDKDGKIPEAEAFDEAQLGIKPAPQPEGARKSTGGPTARMPGNQFR